MILRLAAVAVAGLLALPLTIGLMAMLGDGVSALGPFAGFLPYVIYPIAVAGLWAFIPLEFGGGYLND